MLKSLKFFTTLVLVLNLTFTYSDFALNDFSLFKKEKLYNFYLGAAPVSKWGLSSTDAAPFLPCSHLTLEESLNFNLELGIKL